MELTFLPPVESWNAAEKFGLSSWCLHSGSQRYLEKWLRKREANAAGTSLPTSASEALCSNEMRDIVVPCPSSSSSLSFLFLLFFPSSWWEGTVFVAGDTTLARFLYALSPTTPASASPTCCPLPNTAESGDNQTLFILSVSDLGFWAKRESLVGGGGVRAQQIPNPNRHRYYVLA